jgi:hypothetical protein
MYFRQSVSGTFSGVFVFKSFIRYSDSPDVGLRAIFLGLPSLMGVSVGAGTG